MTVGLCQLGLSHAKIGPNLALENTSAPFLKSLRPTIIHITVMADKNIKPAKGLVYVNILSIKKKKIRQGKNDSESFSIEQT